jgi:hypothetical protein
MTATSQSLTLKIHVEAQDAAQKAAAIAKAFQDLGIKFGSNVVLWSRSGDGGRRQLHRKPHRKIR